MGISKMSKATVYHAKPISIFAEYTHGLSFLTNYQPSLSLLALYPDLENKEIRVYYNKNAIFPTNTSFFFDVDQLPELAEHELSCTVELDINGNWHYYCEIHSND
jgi:hypothetical protein